MAPQPRMLVVDDERDTCECSQKFFGKRGFEVSTSMRGLEALSMMQAKQFDIVLLDLTMPDLNGKEVLERLRETDKNTKVVIISGNYNEELKDQCFSLGIVDYKTKPIVLPELYQLICKELGLPVSSDFVAPSEQTVSRPKVERGALAHQISNKLNIISNACEEFLVDHEDGLYRNFSDGDKLKITIGILDKVRSTAVKTMDILNQIKEGDE